METQFLFSKDSQLPSDFLSFLKKSLEENLPDEDLKILLRLIGYIEGSIKLEAEVIGPQELTYISNCDRDKWVAYLIFRYKFKIFPLLKLVADFPVYLLIEPVSSCNFRCPMCFQVDKSFTRKPYMGIMDFDFYCDIIDQAVAGGVGAITLASRGEPTLHPRFGEMLAYASDKFFELKINTNASKLTEALCHQILSSGVTNLIFSVDWHEKIIYEKLRKGGIFEDTLKNIILLHDIRHNFYPNSKLVTRVSGVKVLDEQQDLDGFKDFWAKFVDEVAITPAEERWDTYSNIVHPESTNPCNYIWERFYVWFDGICNPCDVDYKSMLSTGRLTSNVKIKDVWHGEKYQQLRNTHLIGQRSCLLPCDRCGVDI